PVKAAKVIKFMCSLCRHPENKGKQQVKLLKHFVILKGTCPEGSGKTKTGQKGGNTHNTGSGSVMLMTFMVFKKAEQAQ
ncbi:MAG: hypothetical protein R6V32_04325, partial [Bacteroidales bacterium]